MPHVPRGERPGLHADPMPVLLGLEETPQVVWSWEDAEGPLQMAQERSDQSAGSTLPLPKVIGWKRGLRTSR
jgi:hypothetical protein